MRKNIYYLFIIVLFHSCSNSSVNIEEAAKKSIDSLKPNKTKKVNWIGHWQNEGKREDLVKEVARLFEFENQHVEVNLKFHNELLSNGDKEAMADEIVSIIQSNNYRWDVIWLDDIIYQMVTDKLYDSEWGKKYLVDFSKFDWFIKSQKDFIISDNYYRNLSGGILPGPFIEGYYYALWFNKELADKLNIEVKNKNMTADDLINYARQLNQYNITNNQKIPLLFECGNWKVTHILFQNLFFSEFNQNGGNRNDALKKALKYFENLSKFNPLIENYDELSWSTTQNYPLDEKCFFYIQGTWMYTLWTPIDNEKTKKMYPAELPVFNTSNTYPGGYIPTFAVFKNAPNKEIAIDLFKYWSSPQIAEKWVSYAKNPTGIKGAMVKSTFGMDQFEEFQAYISEKYKQNVRFYPEPSYALGKVSGMDKANFENTIAALLAGKVSADEAYNRLQK